MSIIDPVDGKTVYASVFDLVRKYTPILGSASLVLARLLDNLYLRPDLANPAKVIALNGTGAKASIAHGLKDDAGNKIKPRTWAIQGFTGCAQINILAVDDTNVDFYVTNTGTVDLALFL